MRDLPESFKVFPLHMFLSGFVSHGIKKGAGFRSLVVLANLLFLLKQFFSGHMPAVLLYGLLDRLRPRVSFRISKFKPNITYAPYILTTERSFKLCFRWIFKFSKEKLGLSQPLRLFVELAENLLGEGKTVAARNEVHLLAFSYLKNLRSQRQVSMDMIDNLQISENSKELMRRLQLGDGDSEWGAYASPEEEFPEDDLEEDDYAEEDDYVEADGGSVEDGSGKDKLVEPQNILDSIEDDFFYDDDEGNCEIRRVPKRLYRPDEIYTGLALVLVKKICFAVKRQPLFEIASALFTGSSSERIDEIVDAMLQENDGDSDIAEGLGEFELSEDVPVFEIKDLEMLGLPVEPTSAYCLEMPEE